MRKANKIFFILLRILFVISIPIIICVIYQEDYYNWRITENYKTNQKVFNEINSLINSKDAIVVEFFSEKDFHKLGFNKHKSPTVGIKKGTQEYYSLIKESNWNDEELTKLYKLITKVGCYDVSNLYKRKYSTELKFFGGNLFAPSYYYILTPNRVSKAELIAKDPYDELKYLEQLDSATWWGKKYMNF